MNKGDGRTIIVKNLQLIFCSMTILKRIEKHLFKVDSLMQMLQNRVIPTLSLAFKSMDTGLVRLGGLGWVRLIGLSLARLGLSWVRLG